MDFSEALLNIKAGRKAARAGWNGKGMHVSLTTPVGHPDMQLAPYLIMFAADGRWVPWLASQTDLLADDWGLVP